MSILITTLILGVLILAHELGHFLVAKFVGIKVHEFALGMGPVVMSKQVGETTYSLRAFPVGGFNRMAGTEPGDEDDVRGFNTKSVGKRMWVIGAGSLMNFILAITFFIIVFMGIGVATNSNEIADVIKDGPAAKAGLKSGDRIIAVDGKATPTWEALTSTIRSNPDRELDFTVERASQKFNVTFRTERELQENVGRIGIQRLFEKKGLVEAVVLGVTSSITIIIVLIQSLIQMLVGLAPADVAGPVGMVQLVGQAADLGIGTLINFAALLSLNLGIINLFPIPALDGSRLIFLGIEAVRGRPINPERENFIHFIGFALLIALMLVITYKDVLRIVQ